MAIDQTLTTPTTAPARGQAQAEFDTNIDNRLAWDATNTTELGTWAGEANALAVAVNQDALDAAVSAADATAAAAQAVVVDGYIGVPGQPGFGLGVAPDPLPDGMSALFGSTHPLSDNYGNYQYSDGSIMVWVPAFYYKVGTGSNGLAVNVVDIQAVTAYADIAAANTAGYALHRAFYDGGAVKTGFFVDKFLCSNNSGTASSISLGNPLSSNAAHNPFSGLTGAPTNAYHGAFVAAKTRGANFFCSSLFIAKALALLSLAHAQASSNTTYCAWYDATYNFPKGCNDNALGDVNDGALSFTSDGYSNAAKTGSANVLAKTTHNGQNSGVVDLNGDMWEIAPGLTMDGSTTADKFFVLKTTAAMKDVTGGISLATDLWGATGLAALYDDLGAMSAFTGYALNFSDRVLSYGNAAQVLSGAVSGTPWQMTGVGVPLLSGGTNAFGSEGIWDYSTSSMCPLVGGHWNSASLAGVWALNLAVSRTVSNFSVGFRAALYL